MTEKEQPEAPHQTYSKLRKLLPRALQPVLRGLRKRTSREYQALKEPYRSVYPYTQVHPTRQQNLMRLASDIELKNVDGAIVECGVLDGGTAALMAYATKTSSRKIHLFDSWAGLPKTTEEDGEASKVWENDVVGSPNRVLAVMRHMQIDLGRIIFHKGWFADTFPRARIDRIALLHIDADF